MYSGFRNWPDDVMKNHSEGARNMAFAFFEDAVEKKELPIVLGNFKTERGG